MCRRHDPKCEISMNQIQSVLSECPRFNKILWFSFIVEYTDVVFRFSLFSLTEKLAITADRMSTRERFLVDEAFTRGPSSSSTSPPSHFRLTAVSARGDQENFPRTESRHSGTIRAQKPSEFHALSKRVRPRCEIIHALHFVHVHSHTSKK